MLKGKGEYFQRTTNSSNDIFVVCPRYDLHGGPEHTPSCSIHKEEGMVHCFGCGYSDNIAGMVAYILGLKNSVEGFRWILKKFSMPAKGERPPLKFAPSRYQKKIHIPEDILGLYNQDHPYMFERGLTGEVIDWFDIGFDAETNSITLPMRDINGEISFVMKRPIGRTKFAKYIIEEGADKKDLVYGLFMVKRCLSRVKMIHISEGEMDTLSWYCIDRYGVGIQGDQLFDSQLKQLIRVAKGIPICLSFDNDKAGYKCKLNSARLLRPYFPLYELVYPDDQFYKDPNALLRARRLETCNIRPYQDL
jgi:DNA primase